jgi:hypothetical protein
MVGNLNLKPGFEAISSPDFLENLSPCENRI